MARSIVFKSTLISVLVSEHVLLQSWVLLIIGKEWASGDLGAVAEWDFGNTSDGIHYHKVWKQNQQAFSEVSDRAEWGNWVRHFF